MGKDEFKINGDYKNKDILSIDQFSSKDIEILFKTTDKMKKLVLDKSGADLLKHKIMTALFYEASSRTFGSFTSGMQRLGGNVLPIQDMKNSSAGKGESLEDTAQVFEAYSDVLVVRHPEVGSVTKMADKINIPVINAGDGVGEHPTQALYDLYTINQELGRTSDIHLAFFGELAHYRAVNSLAMLLSIFPKNKITFVSPKEVKINPQVQNYLKSKSFNFNEIENIDEVIGDIDILYVTRAKKEFLPPALYEEIKGKYVVDKKLISEMKKKSIIMHALPRIDEISTDVDSDPRAVYLRSQIKNGMYIRMALLALVLGKA